MPSSSPAFVPEVVILLETIMPKRILDVGFGWGKYAVISREFLQGKVDGLIIDGIEPFEPYIKDHQRALYDTIYKEPIEDIVDDLEKYDLILVMDIIEHLPKETGEEVLRKLLRKTKWIIVSTPNGFYEQGAEFGNERERHLSGWTNEDFDNFSTVKAWGNPVALMHLLKGEVI